MKFFIWTCSLAFFSMGIAIVTNVLSIIAEKSLSPENSRPSGIINYLDDNLNGAPIQEIQLIVSKDPCPNGYDLLDLGPWPGTDSGCLQWKMAGKAKTCNDSVEALDAQPIYSWDGYGFCVKRNIDFEYAPDIKCQSGMKKCFDDLCVDESEKCPITSVSLTDNNEPDTDDDDGEITFLDFKGSFLKIKRKINQNPIFTIQYSMYDKPCYAKGWIPENEGYIIVMLTDFGCSKYGTDEDVEVLDEMLEEDLYDENDFNEVFDYLSPYRESIKGDSVLLVVRKKVERLPKEECYSLDFKQIPRKTVVDGEDAVSSMGYTYIIEFVFIASGIIHFCTCVFKEKLTRKCYKIACNPLTIMCLLFGGVRLLLSALNMTGLPSLKALSEAYEDFPKIENTECFHDEVYNQGCEDFNTYLIAAKQMHKIFLAIWILSGARLGIVLIYMIVGCFKRKDIFADFSSMNAYDGKDSDSDSDSDDSD